MNKRTPSIIIEDWAFSVWKVNRPSSFEDRRAAYFQLFATMSEEGYSWEDVGLMEERLIKSYTLMGGNKIKPSQKKEREEAIEKYILEAKMAFFGPRGAISKMDPKFNFEKKEDGSIWPVKEENPPQEEKARKHFIPDKKEIEKFESMFKFDLTLEDLEDE